MVFFALIPHGFGPYNRCISPMCAFDILFIHGLDYQKLPLRVSQFLYRKRNRAFNPVQAVVYSGSSLYDKGAVIRHAEARMPD